MKYLSTHENLKLPIIYRWFPRFFMKAIQVEVAKVAHLIVPPNAVITGREVTLSLAKPITRPFSKQIPSGYELNIYSMFGLLNYTHLNICIDTNPRLWLYSKCKDEVGMMQVFDDCAKLFAKEVGMKREKGDAVESSRKLLLNLLANGRVLQLGYFGIEVKCDNHKFYQITKI